jgi:hypothetical protein
MPNIATSVLQCALFTHRRVTLAMMALWAPCTRTKNTGIPVVTKVAVLATSGLPVSLSPARWAFFHCAELDTPRTDMAERTFTKGLQVQAQSRA